jgi:hypothetical protein
VITDGCAVRLTTSPEAPGCAAKMGTCGGGSLGSVLCDVCPELLLVVEYRKVDPLLSWAHLQPERRLLQMREFPLQRGRRDLLSSHSLAEKPPDDFEVAVYRPSRLPGDLLIPDKVVEDGRGDLVEGQAADRGEDDRVETPAEDKVLALTAWADYLPTASCSSTWCAMRIFSGLTSNTGRVVPSSTFSAMFPRTNL